MISLPFLNHLTVGVGDPSMGMSILMGSPALTLMSLPPSRLFRSSLGAAEIEQLKFVIKNKHCVYLFVERFLMIPLRGLALIVLEGSDGSDSPPSLMAVTLYSYSCMAFTLSSLNSGVCIKVKFWYELTPVSKI